MVRGERVVLRPVDAEADLERCFQWFNDPEVTRYLCNVGPPITREQEREILSRPRDPAHEVLFAIDAEDGTHIGNCALHRICRLSRSAILGITLGDKSRWSQGYGTDAVRTLCAFAFVELNLQRIGLTLHARNDRARRCYEKCGFQVEGRLRRAVYSRGAYDDELVMGVLREEFQAKHPERWPSEE